MAVLENKGSTWVTVLDHKGNTGWQFSITRGAQGDSAGSQEEYREVVLDFKRSTGCGSSRAGVYKGQHAPLVLDYKRSTGW